MLVDGQEACNGSLFSTSDESCSSRRRGRGEGNSPLKVNTTYHSKAEYRTAENERAESQRRGERGSDPQRELSSCRGVW